MLLTSMIVVGFHRQKDFTLQFDRSLFCSGKCLSWFRGTFLCPHP